MKDNEELLNVLIEHTGIDRALLKSVYRELPADADLNAFRSKLLDSQLISYEQLMSLSIQEYLVPKTKALLAQLFEDEKQLSNFDQPVEEKKFHLDGVTELKPTFMLGNTQLELAVPKTDISKLVFQHSDEKQAIMLAMDMCTMGEVKEAELILIETVDSFPESTAAQITLCWLYFSAGKFKQVEEWAQHLLDIRPTSILGLWFQAQAEQLNSNHRAAITHFQNLVKLKKAMPLWHLLLGYSLQQTGANDAAVECYRTFLNLGNFGEQSKFAIEQVKELSQ